MSEVTATATPAEATPVPPVQAQAEAPAAQKAKVKVEKTGNLLLDVSSEIENLTKLKALNLADKLSEDIDTNSFRLGGVLTVIFENGWFEGYDSFGSFVANRFGFQERKARYLMEIYAHLIKKNIPWEKVQGLGWTKLKELARHLTLENVDEWVKKATDLSFVELVALLKAAPGAEGEPSKTTSDQTTLKFKLKNDQLETVQSALSKAKAETNTEFDNVALENICAGYLAGTVTAAAPAKPADLKEVMAAVGWESVLNAFGELFPKVDLTVNVQDGA